MSWKAAHRQIDIVQGVCARWSNYFLCGHPNRRFYRVNDYVRNRLIILAKHTSQRGYKLKYAQSYYHEWKAMGLYEMRKRRP